MKNLVGERNPIHFSSCCVMTMIQLPSNFQPADYYNAFCNLRYMILFEILFVLFELIVGRQMKKQNKTPSR
jgi:hypothetical protein